MTSPQQALVSVNIVTRNRREALAKAIHSVCNQTYQPIELVVVDNDSSDGSADMVESEWPQARVIRIHRNIGCQPGRNIGMKNCRGTYIFNLDDDGWLEPSTIKQIVDRFRKDDAVGLIMAGIVAPEGSYASTPTNVPYEQRVIGNFVGAAHAVRASVLDTVGYFPEYPRGASESNLALRMIDAGYELLHLPNAIMYHELSQIERSDNTHRYFHVWHDLENVCRLYPLTRIPFTCIWKAGLHGYRALGQGTFRGYCRGIIRFIYELPMIIQERKPVRRWAVQKQSYLVNSTITSLEDSKSFKGYGFWETVRDRLLKPNRASQGRSG
ncbi:MAG: glycosyltransferase [FCB group bacterium]|jgi:GT2 family glycosyltransferase|nr:glycosyltransferase [FCB group bacterium]